MHKRETSVLAAGNIAQKERRCHLFDEQRCFSPLTGTRSGGSTSWRVAPQLILEYKGGVSPTGGVKSSPIISLFVGFAARRRVPPVRYTRVHVVWSPRGHRYLPVAIFLPLNDKNQSPCRRFSTGSSKPLDVIISFLLSSLLHFHLRTQTEGDKGQWMKVGTKGQKPQGGSCLDRDNVTWLLFHMQRNCHSFVIKVGCCHSNYTQEATSNASKARCIRCRLMTEDICT